MADMFMQKKKRKNTRTTNSNGWSFWIFEYNENNEWLLFFLRIYKYCMCMIYCISYQDRNDWGSDYYHHHPCQNYPPSHHHHWPYSFVYTKLILNYLLTQVKKIQSILKRTHINNFLYYLFIINKKCMLVFSLYVWVYVCIEKQSKQMSNVK